MKNSGERKYEHPFLGTYGEFTWCLHCERVHNTQFCVQNGWDCPEEGCEGNFIDAYSWEPRELPRSENPDYPSVPVEEGYPLNLVNCFDR